MLALPPALEEWRREIEAAGGAPVYVAEVEFSADGQQMRLAEGVEGRELFVRYLRQEDFVRQFVMMRGVLVSHQAPEGAAHLVMLNGGRRKEWERHEAALVGHEFGHAWLRARKYPTPVFQPGPLACLAVHTGDIVQHVLIRREMERRGIGHEAMWLESLERAVEAARGLADGEGTRRARAGDACLALRQAAEWVDVRLGFAGRGADRPGVIERYESEMRRVFPEVEPVAGAIAEAVGAREVEDRQQHRDVLREAHARLRALAESLRQ